METKPLRNPKLGIFKTLNNLNPEEMSKISHKNTDFKYWPLDITFNQNDTTKYGNKSLRSVGPKIWNFLSMQKIKSGNKQKGYKLYQEINWSEM